MATSDRTNDRQIDLGTGIGSTGGEPIRNAFEKINQNFDDLYSIASDLSNVNRSIIPDANETYNIGSPLRRFNDIYLSGSTINLGNTTISVNNDGELEFDGVKVPTQTDLNTAISNVQSGALTGNLTGDVTGSVFADDSTLLVDGVNGTIPASVVSGTITNTINTNTIATSSGNLTITADNYVRIDSDNNGQIEIGRNSGVGNVIIGNSANNTEVVFEGTVTTLAVFGNPTLALNADFIGLDAQNGNLVLQTSDTITNNFVNLWEVQGISASMELTDDGVNSELGLNVNVVDFGTGNTIDMQNCSVLFNGATVQDLSVPYVASNPATQTVEWDNRLPVTLQEAIDRIATVLFAQHGPIT